MQKSQITYRWVIFLFNGATLASVVAGIVNFFFFGHDYERSQLYLVAALASLGVVAVASRMLRTRIDQAEVDEGRSHKNVPAWVYWLVVICSIFPILNLFTFKSAILDLYITALLAIALGKIISDRYKNSSKATLNLSPVQRLGIALGVCGLLLNAYRLMLMLLK